MISLNNLKKHVKIIKQQSLPVPGTLYRLHPWVYGGPCDAAIRNNQLNEYQRRWKCLNKHEIVLCIRQVAGNPDLWEILYQGEILVVKAQALRYKVAEV